jgi:hypothetical protein
MATTSPTDVVKVNGTNAISTDKVIELLIDKQFTTLKILIDFGVINLANIRVYNFVEFIYKKAPGNFADIFNFIMENGFILTCANLYNSGYHIGIPQDVTMADIVLNYLEKNPHKYDVGNKNIPGTTILYYWDNIDCIKRLLKIYPNYPHYSLDISNQPWWFFVPMSQALFDYLSGVIDMHKKFIPIQGELKSYAEGRPDIMAEYGSSKLCNSLEERYKKKEEEYDQLKVKYDSLVQSIMTIKSSI